MIIDHLSHCSWVQDNWGLSMDQGQPNNLFHSLESMERSKQYGKLLCPGVEQSLTQFLFFLCFLVARKDLAPNNNHTQEEYLWGSNTGQVMNPACTLHNSYTTPQPTLLQPYCNCCTLSQFPRRPLQRNEEDNSILPSWKV